jgi:hypothetical protein
LFHIGAESIAIPPRAPKLAAIAECMGTIANMIRNFSRRQALLGTSAALATPFLGSLMAKASSIGAAEPVDASPLLKPWPGGYGGVPPWDKFKAEMRSATRAPLRPSTP